MGLDTDCLMCVHLHLHTNKILKDCICPDRGNLAWWIKGWQWLPESWAALLQRVSLLGQRFCLLGSSQSWKYVSINICWIHQWSLHANFSLECFSTFPTTGSWFSIQRVCNCWHWGLYWELKESSLFTDMLTTLWGSGFSRKYVAHVCQDFIFIKV